MSDDEKAEARKTVETLADKVLKFLSFPQRCKNCGEEPPAVEGARADLEREIARLRKLST